MLMVSITAMLPTSAYVSIPRLDQVLAFRDAELIRLTVIETKTGIALFNHLWEQSADSMDEMLFSGMLQGISNFVNELLKKGNVREIQLDQGRLLLHQNHQSPAIFVLVTNKSFKALREALKSFAEKFIGQFAPNFSNPSNIDQFLPAKDFVAECFPFVPKKIYKIRQEITK